MSLAMPEDFDLIGCKVMMRGNEHGVIKVGEVVEFMEVSQARVPMPVVELENGEKVVAFSTLMKYDEGLYGYLSGLSEEDQVRIFVDNIRFGRKLERATNREVKKL